MENKTKYKLDKNLSCHEYRHKYPKSRDVITGSLIKDFFVILPVVIGVWFLIEKIVTPKEPTADVQLLALETRLNNEIVAKLKSGRVKIADEVEYKCVPTEMTRIYKIINNDAHLEMLKKYFGPINKSPGFK